MERVYIDNTIQHECIEDWVVTQILTLLASEVLNLEEKEYQLYSMLKVLPVEVLPLVLEKLAKDIDTIECDYTVKTEILFMLPKYRNSFVNVSLKNETNTAGIDMKREIAILILGLIAILTLIFGHAYNESQRKEIENTRFHLGYNGEVVPDNILEQEL